MHKTALTFFAIFCIFTQLSFAETATKDEARKHAQQLGKTLATELQTAMRSGGPIAAIDVCNLKALPLTHEVTEASGWNIKRTSLKVRNPANQPDPWEIQQMKNFDAALAVGTHPQSLETLEIHFVNDVKTIRFMKAIPTESACLTCHGQQLDTEIITELNHRYPNDQARGFEVGELRGAFSLQKIIE